MASSEAGDTSAFSVIAGTCGVRESKVQDFGVRMV